MAGDQGFGTVNLGLDTTPGTKANSIGVYAATAPAASVTGVWDLEAEYTCTVSLQVNGHWTQSATLQQMFLWGLN